MTAAPVVAPPVEVTSRPRQGRRFNLGSLPTHIVIVALMVIWLIPTIGLLVNSFRSQQDAVTTGWWTALFPGLAIMIAVMGVNLLGDGLRDALDPEMRA